MRKNSRLDPDSNPDLQLYALALCQLSHPDKLLGLARIFLLFLSPCTSGPLLVPPVDGDEHLPDIIS